MYLCMFCTQICLIEWPRNEISQHSRRLISEMRCGPRLILSLDENLPDENSIAYCILDHSKIKIWNVVSRKNIDGNRNCWDTFLYVQLHISHSTICISTHLSVRPTHINWWHYHINKWQNIIILISLHDTLKKIQICLYRYHEFTRDICYKT